MNNRQLNIILNHALIMSMIGVSQVAQAQVAAPPPDFIIALETTAFTPNSCPGGRSVSLDINDNEVICSALNSDNESTCTATIPIANIPDLSGGSIIDNTLSKEAPTLFKNPDILRPTLKITYSVMTSESDPGSRFAGLLFFFGEDGARAPIKKSSEGLGGFAWLDYDSDDLLVSYDPLTGDFNYNRSIRIRPPVDADGFNLIEGIDSEYFEPFVFGLSIKCNQ